jgi:glucose-6-phosphate 1-dehydrogenase
MDYIKEELTTIVIFGASGDLSKRKLIPSLFSLFRKGKLSGGCRLIGFSTSKWSDDEFRAVMREALEEHYNLPFKEDEWEEFKSHLFYLPGRFTNIDDFKRLAAELEKDKGDPDNRLYYLAAPPRFFADIVENLDQVGMAQEAKGFRRIVIEKPFGKDLLSAQALNHQIHRSLGEHQIFRIDHYLGKETVQNVLVFRFANSIFEPIWNRNYIDHIQITVAERVGVEHRGRYYDRVGVVRDMFQNHLLQLLTLVAMEPPASFDADARRNERVKVLKAVRPILAEDILNNTVRGQYKGYRDENGVDPNSQTATYAAIRFYIDNWRWQGVPFYLRSGKKMAKKTTEIAIQFKEPPHSMFPMSSDMEFPPNILSLCLQPDEGIHLRFETKVPDTMAETKSVDMEFHYAESFEGQIPDAYERLLLDAVQGDASLFTRSDQIELGWQLVDPIISGWLGSRIPELSFYEPGIWGPNEADELIERKGRKWLAACGMHSL